MNAVLCRIRELRNPPAFGGQIVYLTRHLLVDLAPGLGVRRQGDEQELVTSISLSPVGVRHFDHESRSVLSARRDGRSVGEVEVGELAAQDCVEGLDAALVRDAHRLSADCLKRGVLLVGQIDT